MDDNKNSDTSWVDLSIAGNSVYSKYVNTYPYSSTYPARAYSSKYYDKTYAMQSVYMKYNSEYVRSYASNYPYGSISTKLKGYKLANTAWTGSKSPYRGVTAKTLAWRYGVLCVNLCFCRRSPAWERAPLFPILRRSGEGWGCSFGENNDRHNVGRINLGLQYLLAWIPCLLLFAL